MRKQAWLKAINPLLFILVIFQVTTALLHDVVKGDWFEDLHPAGGVLLAIVAMFHLYLNWNWVRTSYFKKTGP